MTKKFRFLFICIHPNLFANEDIEENYFRVFENLTNEKSIINLDNPEYENLINNSPLFEIDKESSPAFFVTMT